MTAHKSNTKSSRAGIYRRQAESTSYAALFTEIKTRIQTAQTRAMLAVNSELVRLYWDIGKMIDQRQKEEGWGAGIIPKLAAQLKNDIPELKGFSERNIKRMLAFYRLYSEPAVTMPQVVAQNMNHDASSEIVPQPVALSSQSLLWQVPWAHHVILMDKVKDHAVSRWYMEQTLCNGWSRNILAMQIESKAHIRHGKARSNFSITLPEHQSDLVQQTLKDPYIFDFLTLTEYSFAGIDKPIGISTYELTRSLPDDLKSSLPSVEEIEAELNREVGE